MRKIDDDGLLLCKLQAEAFELSISKVETSSPVFIRRFMHSQVARLMDNLGALEIILLPKDMLDLIEEEYGPSSYGSEKYTQNEMYWIGYIYRYFSYTYEKSALQVYRIVKPHELRGMYLPYHTMDPSQAIERILEAKGLIYNEEEEFRRQYEIYCRVRDSKRNKSNCIRKNTSCR